jgi:hypothetical protein
LTKNLQNLGVLVATVNGDINKIHGKFDRNHSQLLPHGITIDNPIGLLFKSYLVVPCNTFKEYIPHHHDDWLDRKLTGMTHETLMTFATHKCNYLKTKGTWGAKSPGDKKRLKLSRDISRLRTSLETLSRAKA